MSETGAATDVFVEMRVVSGHGADTQWFDYSPGYFMDPIRIEWDLGTMFAALPPGAAGYLLKNGYARAMTEAEIEEYTGAAKKLPEPPPVVTPIPPPPVEIPVVVAKAKEEDPPTPRRKKEKT